MKDASAGNLAFAGTNWYEYYTSTVDTVNPTVTQIAPTASSTVGGNALVRVTFSKNIDPLSIDASSATLTSGGSIPYAASYDTNTFTLTMTPQAPLPSSASVNVALSSAVTDTAGNTLTAFSSSFNTSAAPDFTRPTVLLTSVVNGETGVPVNASFTFTFSKPMDTRTFALNNNIYLYDNSVGYVPSTLSFSPDGTQATITPLSLLAVNRGYYAYTCYGQDLTGNTQNNCSSYSFTTTLAALSGNPQVTFVLPPSGLTVPTNFKPQVQFDRAVNPVSFNSITLMQGGTPVPFTASATGGGTIIVLTPNSLLPASSPFTLTITGVTDTGGTAMTGSVVRTFSSGPSFDLVAPVVISATPQSGETTGTLPTIRMVFNEPINPLNSSSANLYNSVTGRTVAGFTLTTAADLLSQTLAYTGVLDPNTTYCWTGGYFYDLAGNYSYRGTTCFVTGIGVDNSAPTISNVSPPNGQAGVPLNATIAVTYNKAIDATTVTNSSLTLSPAPPAGTTVQLSSDAKTISLALGGSLTASTNYTLAASGVKDLNGNTATPLASSTFQTGAAIDSSHGTISLTSPAAGSNGVATNSTVVLTLSKPVNPSSITTDSFVVLATNDNSKRIAGTIAVSNGGLTLTFNPAAAMPPSTAMYVYASYYGYLFDLAGNNFNYLTTSFTTASTPDNTPPQIISVTPANGSTNVGPNAAVTITFSKSLDANTINGQNFTLYNGFSNLGASVSRASDNKSVTLTTTLPYSKTLTLSVSTGVKDLAGNSLANPWQSTFTTVTQPQTTSPNVSQMRPGGGASGVPLNSTITLYFDAALNPSTVPGAFYVSQNGALVSGNVVAGPDGRSAVFTPSAPFVYNANVQVFFTGATDNSGNGVSYFASSFRTVTDQTGVATTLASASPYYTSNNPLNVTPEVTFTRPLDPATAIAANFYIASCNGAAPAGTISLFNGNKGIRFTPSAPFPASSYCYLYWTSNLHDVNSQPVTGSSFYFYLGASVDNTPPTITSASPYDTAAGVGDNASIRITFSKLMDTLSINPSTVSLMNGATPIPFSLTFSGSAITTATLSPLQPLPDNATITLSLTNAIGDLAGNTIAGQTTTFHTANGADFNRPNLIYSSIEGGAANVPLNASFTLVFDKPLDPGTVASNGYFVYKYDGTYPAVNLSVSADGRTVTLVPTSNLTPSYNYYLASYYATDLNGNPQSNFTIGFVTGTSADTNAPQVSDVTPNDTSTQVPVNALIEVRFNEPVRSTSLTQVTLKSGVNTVPIAASLIYGDSTVLLTPQVLLQPSTSYTVTVQGVQDTAGNTMSGTYTYSFSTGPNALLTSTPNIVSVIANGSPLSPSVTLNIPDNPTIVVAFDTPVEPASLFNGGLRLVLDSNWGISYPLSIALSADQKTATVTLAPGTLASGTEYRMTVGYYTRVRDWAGNYNGGAYVYYPFVTQ